MDSRMWGQCFEDLEELVAWRDKQLLDGNKVAEAIIDRTLEVQAEKDAEALRKATLLQIRDAIQSQGGELTNRQLTTVIKYLLKREIK